MKIKSLEIKNIGKIKDIALQIDKPLILFYGECMQGKTTILNAIKYVFGRSFPNDIINHEASEGYIFINFDDGSIRREFYRSKDNITKARPIQFIKFGQLVKKPSDAIKEFLNPFLLDQDYFLKMSGLERNRYFIDIFGIDTKELDQKIEKNEEEAKRLRQKIKLYGDIDLTPIETINVELLQKEKNYILNKADIERHEIDKQNEQIREYNANYHLYEINLSDAGEEIEKLKVKLRTAQDKYEKCKKWLLENEKKDLLQQPSYPDTSDIDNKISEAKAQNIRYEQYLNNKARQAQKNDDQEKLNESERLIRHFRQSKIDMLSELSNKCKIEGLKFDENGKALYEDTALDMLSMSQIMRLSSALSSLYPAGFGLELIDRGESLGKSIFEFISKAKREEKTILSTIVGEKPAEIPEEIGVWVVENGELKIE